MNSIILLLNMKDIITFLNENRELTLNYNVNDKAMLGNDGLKQTTQFNEFIRNIKKDKPDEFKIFLHGLGHYGDLSATCEKYSENMYKVSEYILQDKTYKLDKDFINSSTEIFKMLKNIITDKYKKDIS